MEPNLIGKTLGQYQILEELGRDETGVLYKAYQPSLKRHVALKVLPTHLARDASFIRALQRELQAVARLNDPNIAYVYDFGQADGLCYVVMEYIAGPTLDQALEKQTTFSLSRIVAFIRRLASALDHAHRQGVIHGSLKPGSIVLAPDGRHDSGWQTGIVNLSQWRGQEEMVRFAVWNREYDGNGLDYYNTWAYLDQVRVEP